MRQSIQYVLLSLTWSSKVGQNATDIITALEKIPTLPNGNQHINCGLLSSNMNVIIQTCSLKKRCNVNITLMWPADQDMELRGNVITIFLYKYLMISFNMHILANFLKPFMHLRLQKFHLATYIKRYNYRWLLQA